MTTQNDEKRDESQDLDTEQQDALDEVFNRNEVFARKESRSDNPYFQMPGRMPSSFLILLV